MEASFHYLKAKATIGVMDLEVSLDEETWVYPHGPYVTCALGETSNIFSFSCRSDMNFPDLLFLL